MDQHRWLLTHLISVISYCEAQGLQQIARPLTEAMEKIAPQLSPKAALREGPSPIAPDHGWRTSPAAAIFKPPGPLAAANSPWGIGPNSAAGTKRQ